ncbi:TPA: transcriptional regulator, partial [Klebsiella pneumoniae]
THKPSFELVCSFAKVLDVPECYFYTVDDEFAEAVLALYQGFKTES